MMMMMMIIAVSLMMLQLDRRHAAECMIQNRYLNLHYKCTLLVVINNEAQELIIIKQ